YVTPLVEGFGAGTFLLAGLVTALGAAIALRRLRCTRRGLMLAAGCGLLALVLWGVAGRLQPGWSLGGTRLNETTLGGAVGRGLTGSPLGLALWLGAVAGASAILWPRLSLRVLSSIPPASRAVWRWRVPQRLFGTMIDGFRALLLSGDGDHGARRQTA